MLINEQGIKAAVQRKQDNDNYQLTECKQFLLETFDKMNPFEEKFQNIFETFDYCRENKITELIPTLLEIDNVSVYVAPDFMNHGKYEILEFNNSSNSVSIKLWPLSKWIIIKQLSALTGTLHKIEARVHNNQIMLLNTSNAMFRYTLKEKSVESFLKKLPKIVKKTTDTILNKLNEIS